MLDFIRVACGVPDVQVGNGKQNVQQLCRLLAQADEQQADVLVFPELSLTGYSCGDLFFQNTLHQGEKEAFAALVEATKAHPLVTVVVSLTVTTRGQCYDCAAVLGNGRVFGIVPKTFLSEEERRYFASASDLEGLVDGVDGRSLGLEWDCLIPMGRDLIFTLADGTTLAVELGNESQAPVPQSVYLAMQGAEVIVNPAAFVQTAGAGQHRRESLVQQSRQAKCIYVMASAGCLESTQDVVYSGHSLVAENGRLLAENREPVQSGYLLVTDADLGPLRHDRRADQNWRQCTALYGTGIRRVPCGGGKTLRGDGSGLYWSKQPFAPEDEKARRDYCLEAFQIQVAGLKRRLMTIGAKPVVGVSGGLDSTLALLVCAEAMRQLGRPASEIYGITMPCFGTSHRTHNNSLELMEQLGITSREISIRNAVSGHFADIGHDPQVLNATYENAQARERTQVLMDYAGMVGGIVIGTGDLSELALGWCTFNGDHMSMYSVNGSIPKTLMRWMIQAIAQQPDFAGAKPVLEDILDTPISPELLPPDAHGKIAQQTEDLVGPYVLHDFFLYYLLRYGYGPKKIYTLACRAFREDFPAETIKKWLCAFYRRFFTQQFKRNCQPDGVKALALGLGPRGDWKMPSDASSQAWMAELETL